MFFFFFKQKTAYEIKECDWSSDVCSSDLNECRRLGFDILIPDINKSSSRYTVENGAMRIGLGQLKDLSTEFMKKILNQREQGGFFKDFYDFLRKIGRASCRERV